jgi:hypothetical protein
MVRRVLPLQGRRRVLPLPAVGALPVRLRLAEVVRLPAAMALPALPRPAVMVRLAHLPGVTVRPVHLPGVTVRPVHLPGVTVRPVHLPGVTDPVARPVMAHLAAATVRLAARLRMVAASHLRRTNQERPLRVVARVSKRLRQSLLVGPR